MIRYLLIILTFFSFRASAAQKVHVSLVEIPSDDSPFGDAIHLYLDRPSKTAWLVGHSDATGFRWSQRKITDNDMDQVEKTLITWLKENPREKPPPSPSSTYRVTFGEHAVEWQGYGLEWSLSTGVGRSKKLGTFLKDLLEGAPQSPIAFAPFDGELRIDFVCGALSLDGKLAIEIVNKGLKPAMLHPMREHISKYWGYLPLSAGDAATQQIIGPGQKIRLNLQLDLSTFKQSASQNQLIYLADGIVDTAAPQAVNPQYFPIRRCELPNELKQLSGPVKAIPKKGPITDIAVSSATTCSIQTTPPGLTCFGDPIGGIAPPKIFMKPTQVVLGEHHACVVDSGQVKCWGSDEAGELSVPSITNATMVALGTRHSCAIDSSTLKCWGDASEGALNAPALKKPYLIAAAGNSTCAADAEGIKCWGNNALKSRWMIPKLPKISALSMGNGGACAIADGKVQCWGQEKDLITQAATIRNPQKISVGPNYACAIADQKLACWGSPWGPASESGQPPMKAPTLIAAGKNHICALDAGYLNCWGSNEDRQFGLHGPSVTKDELEPRHRDYLSKLPRTYQTLLKQKFPDSKLVDLCNGYQEPIKDGESNLLTILKPAKESYQYMIKQVLIDPSAAPRVMTVFKLPGTVLGNASCSTLGPACYFGETRCLKSPELREFIKKNDGVILHSGVIEASTRNNICIRVEEVNNNWSCFTLNPITGNYVLSSKIEHAECCEESEPE